jgi:DNA-binding transcriptional LysR family regulator
MNFRQIEAFRLIMLRGTMTSAAEELHTSQPSISRLISELEASLKLKLFTRQAGRLQPTDAGNAFYQEVERSFVGMDNLKQSAQQIRNFGTGRLRVAATPAIALSTLPDVIVEYRKQYPNVIVSLEMRSESTVRRWASASYCDIGFATAAAETLGVNVETLYRFPALCVIPSHHRLAKKKIITIKDLDGEELILPSHPETTRQVLDKTFESAGMIPIPAIETPYGASTVALAQRNVGIGFVNPLVACSAKHPGVVFLPFSVEMYFEGYVIYPKVHDYNPVVQHFIRITREHINTINAK